MNADGSNPNRLTFTNFGQESIDPLLSPDGTKIAFASGTDLHWEIYVMNADGTNQIRLTFNAGEDRYPS